MCYCVVRRKQLETKLKTAAAAANITWTKQLGDKQSLGEKKKMQPFYFCDSSSHVESAAIEIITNTTNHFHIDKYIKRYSI
jgi:hypothetical protein